MASTSSNEAVQRLTQLLGEVPEVDPELYLRRRLPDDVLENLPPSVPLNRQSECLEIDLGLIDIPLDGQQPSLTVSLLDMPLWFVGPRSSGRTHNLRNVVGEVTHRFPEVAVIVINSALGAAVVDETVEPFPLVVDGSNLLEASLVIEQLHSDLFLSGVPRERFLLVIDRADRLYRSFASSEPACKALAELLNDGVSRGVAVAASADSEVRGLLSADAEVVQLVKDADSRVPTVRTASGYKGATYSKPHPVAACEPQAHVPDFLVPEFDGFDTLRAQVASGREIPLGKRWIDHAEIRFPEESIVFAGAGGREDTGSGSVLEMYASLFKTAGDLVVQLSGHREDSKWEVGPSGSADLVFDVSQTSGAEIVEQVNDVLGADVDRPVRLFYPDLERYSHLLEKAGDLAKYVGQHGWQVIASSQMSAYRNKAKLSVFLATFEHQVWLNPTTARTGLASEAVRFTLRPGIQRASQTAALFMTATGLYEISLPQMRAADG